MWDDDQDDLMTNHPHLPLELKNFDWTAALVSLQPTN
jgi:hypothetical protein